MDSGKWWPSIESQSNATDVMHFAAFTAGLSAFVTAGISLDAIYEGHAVMGISGWALVDAAVFAIVAWRIYRLSLPWAIVGLALFTVEKTGRDYASPGYRYGDLRCCVFPVLPERCPGWFLSPRGESDRIRTSSPGLCSLRDSQKARRSRRGKRRSNAGGFTRRTR